MAVRLFDYQLDAIRRMRNGCVLCGGVGSGKSLTALGYYYLNHGGAASYLEGSAYSPMPDPPDLYIITTARKRDTFEWEREMAYFLLSKAPGGLYGHAVVVDSWNNIGKYASVEHAFFIFDEQRVVGRGAWVKSFLAIARRNEWILLSATPGDTWQDYVPVFIANGFFKNRTEFTREHVVYASYTRFPKIDRYLNTGRLIRLRSRILVTMDFHRGTVPHHEEVFVEYDRAAYREIMKNRWDIWTDRPIENASGLCYALRRVVNCDETRQRMALEIQEQHPRMIIFYNFDYELELLKTLAWLPNTEIAEWNGHKHQPIPDGSRWVYLVQYNAGAEGWNCVRTDTILFYSQNYSYKVMVQASGRIDRLNTPFQDLYFYHLKTRSGIDLAIAKALSAKKNFNEGGFIKWQK